MITEGTYQLINYDVIDRIITYMLEIEKKHVKLLFFCAVKAFLPTIITLDSATTSAARSKTHGYKMPQGSL